MSLRKHQRHSPAPYEREAAKKAFVQKIPVRVQVDPDSTVTLADMPPLFGLLRIAASPGHTYHPLARAEGGILVRVDGEDVGKSVRFRINCKWPQVPDDEDDVDAMFQDYATDALEFRVKQHCYFHATFYCTDERRAWKKDEISHVVLALACIYGVKNVCVPVNSLRAW